MNNLNIHPEYLTNEHGNKVSVVLPIHEFNELIEDLQDLSIIAQRIDEPTTSHEIFLDELKKDGLL